LVEGPPLQQGTSEQVGDVWVTKKVEAPTFDKKVYQQSIEDRMPPEFKAAIPEQLEQHTVDGEAAMPALAVDDLMRREAQEKAGVKTVARQFRDPQLDTPVLIGQRIDPEFNGATLNLEKSIVSNNATIDQTFGMVQAAIVPYDKDRSVKETWTTDAAGFPTIVNYSVDPEINAVVKTTVRIVPIDDVTDPGATQTSILDWQERKIDAVHKMRIVHTVPEKPAAETSYESKQFTFPGLLVNLTFKLVAIGTAGRSEPQWTAGVRAAFTKPVAMKTVTEYFYDPPERLAITTWAPGDIIFKGVSYSISLSNLLYDSWNNIGVTFAGDTLYGNVVDRFSISATSPSAATYTSWIGTERCISSSVTRYKKLWRRQSVYITIR
jgi:hypothetical protein